MLLDNIDEYEVIWKRVYNELGFKPDSLYRGHSFRQQMPFKIEKQYVVFGIENMIDIHIDRIDHMVKQAFISCTDLDGKMYALDWQHSVFLFNPRENIELTTIVVKDDKYFGGEYMAYFPSYYPDGDYHFFIDKDFKFGYLGHPWRQEVWVFGDMLIQQFENIYEDLGWYKLKES